MPNETIADIVREIREDKGVRMDFHGMVNAVPNIWILKWCDRIEAAEKRENDRLRIYSSSVEHELRDLADWCHNNQSGKTIKHWEWLSNELCDLADALKNGDKRRMCAPKQFA